MKKRSHQTPAFIDLIFNEKDIKIYIYNMFKGSKHSRRERGEVKGLRLLRERVSR